MPAQPRGTIYLTRKRGYGIRWPENGKKSQRDRISH